MNNIIAFSKKHSSKIMKSIFIASIVLFTIIPLIVLLFQISSSDVSFVVNDNRFWLSVKNSAIYSFVSAIICTILSTMMAFLLHRANFKHKNVFVVFMTLPLLIPSLSIGLGIKTLFGKNGFLDMLFGFDKLNLGFCSLILCSVIALFPTTFMIMYDSMKYEDSKIYEASDSLGISRVSSFFHLTLPYLKTSMLYSFVVAFSVIFSDYGIPMETAGLVQTLPIYLYKATMSSFEYGRASICALFMLIPAVLSFISNLFINNNTQIDSRISQIKSSKHFDILSIFILSVFSLFLMIPEISFVVLAFVKQFPNDMTFTFSNFISAFNSSYSLSIVEYVKNSVVLAFFTALLGTAFSYVLAYFSTRSKGLLSKMIEALSTMSLSIPGLVLGLCYIFAFSWSKGFFYNTALILVVVNITHMLGSPYLMAKNALLKQNKNFESVGESLGISKLKIFAKVLIPNSIPTILSMFSYFFVNSMTTVTAVLFLCTYANQPLAVLITVYDKSLDYNMQAVVSFLILAINIVAKFGLQYISSLLEKKMTDNEHTNASLSKDEFIAMTEGNANHRIVRKLEKKGLMKDNCITDKGLKILEQYKVKKVIILAAGFGERLVPVTIDTPKPMVKVNGVRMIETILKQCRDAGIDDITIVVGYKSEQFKKLKKDYHSINFVKNDFFNTQNNISSLYAVKDKLDRCYICEADLLLKDKNLIRKYEYETCFLGFYSEKSDDWCAKLKHGIIKTFKIGGKKVWQTCGISYWNLEEGNKLKASLEKTYNSPGGKECIWDMAAFGKYGKNNIKVGIRQVTSSSITEIDNYSELCELDKSYLNYK